MPKVNLKTIILLSVAFKLLFILFFVNLNDLEFYEYGELAQNLHSEKSYSYVHYTYDPQKGLVASDKAHESAYMPPGYVFYLSERGPAQFLDEEYTYFTGHHVFRQGFETGQHFCRHTPVQGQSLPFLPQYCTGSICP